MFKIVKSVEPVFPVVELSKVEKLITRENKILVSVYENQATFLVRDDKVFFYAFGMRNTHSKSNTIDELLGKQHPLDGSSELYLFDSLKEFFECATKMGWNY
jgi:hypothetical protein